MSKKLFYLATLLFVIMFSSCERNNELVGTTWTASREIGSYIDGSITVTYRLNFITNTTVNIELRSLEMPNHINSNIELTYSYNNSLVRIDNKFNGTFNGNQITFELINSGEDREVRDIDGLTFEKE